ncbi:hypothetical protein SShM2_048 [Synechococcus phage S-ShM2]|uniref:Uncharacterized protein n=2 Tax=Ahtivirus sagseatwo TaxID=2734079 RepID=A0A1D7SLV7_9CAUD|nr:hypothetical protein SShM2_048 [Synechococcus phage S-ShM2]AOO13158.1 hypothetical protein LIS021110_044 [Cyanophage S-RIM14]ADO97659.1 hypothetical protein SShM2_048 [Synechococcus phage S-ShM2]AOO13590.1 hypothetical protein Np111211_044 [Cyanophage S-RIM14]AOO13806.1 hypothetical protein Np450711_044 [Cyanophage S-RIM14]AOO14022.1 hypothetical protein RW030110_044 [Cyanophage S-RIM14]
MIRNAILSGLFLTLTGGVAVSAMENITPANYNTNHSMGCMLLGECTDQVEAIWGIGYLKQQYPEANWSPVEVEFTRILNALTLVDVQVYLAPQKYFPVGHRGVYHTVSNNFYLNDAFMHRPHVLMSVVRHEGWHAAQDCMAGTIDNSMIAIIKPEDEVPMIWQEMVNRTYPPAARPWEKEATWAGKTEGMTQEALESCARGTMWTDYDPTPMTREWLQQNGYIN